MALVEDVFKEVREHLPSFYPTGSDIGATPETEALALGILNKAQVDLMRMVDLYPYEDVSIDLTSGVSEYALDPDIIRINAAQYRNSSTSATPLRPTSIDQMDTDSPAWRTYAISGQPYLFYTQGGNVGFYQAPNRTTTLGYPKVVLNVLRRHDFTDLTDPLPAQADKTDAWVFATCVHWCLRMDRGSLELFVPLADAAARDLQDLIRRIPVRLKDRIRADLPYPR